MKTDVIVYEKKNALTRIALLGAGEPQEFEFIKENQAAEGNMTRGSKFIYEFGRNSTVYCFVASGLLYSSIKG